MTTFFLVVDDLPSLFRRRSLDSVGSDENALNRRAVIVEVLHDALHVMMRDRDLVAVYFSPIVVEDVVAEHPDVSGRTSRTS